MEVRFLEVVVGIHMLRGVRALSRQPPDTQNRHD